MKVIYRITGISSSNPSPIYWDNKLELNRVCLKSFVAGFNDIKPEVIFLLDNAGAEHEQMIDDTCTFDYEIHRSNMGINETMIRSYEIAAQMDDFVLFEECDYLYRPKIGKLFYNALQNLSLVSPYDHRNFYLDKSIHSDTVRLKLVNNHHFRTTERNTMTWGTHASIVKENLDFLIKHGYLDVGVWEDFRFAGYPLWVPIPSMATHMITDYLAPGENWEALWKKYQ